jgi:simple sugar transport system permease protein
VPGATPDAAKREEHEQELARQRGVQAEHSGSRWGDAMREVFSSSALVLIGAAILAILVGSIMIAATNSGVQAAAGYFFQRPGDTFSAIGKAVGGAYAALFRGAIYNYNAKDFATGIKPLTLSLHNAGPLIAAGLGVALAFRAGMFNIGGQGQIIMGAIGAGWIGFGIKGIPAPWHAMIAVVVGIACGALWGGLAGWLKARTGAHEVIVTIMLNWIAFYLLAYGLATKGLLQSPTGQGNPKSSQIQASAALPKLFGNGFALHWGFILVLAAVVYVWWLLNRSSQGFNMRVIGENPRAGQVAGINVSRTTVMAMVIAGGLVGLAGVYVALGRDPSTASLPALSGDVDGGFGFDAITVALLGGSNPIGVAFAGLLFGAFRAGGTIMQTNQGIDVNIVSVVQSLIVLFIAAPPLVRTVFGLPQPGRKRKLKKERKAAAMKEVAA